MRIRSVSIGSMKWFIYALYVHVGLYMHVFNNLYNNILHLYFSFIIAKM